MGLKPKRPWVDKEVAYSRSWESGRISKDLWKYIPTKYRDAVVDCSVDSDGYWIWLDHECGGWTAYDGAEDCGVIHEYTIADIIAAIRTIRRIK